MVRLKIGRAYILPICLFALALLTALVALLMQPQGLAYSAKIDLAQGAQHNGEFKVRHDRLYYIGLEMNQKAAQTHFPCAVDIFSLNHVMPYCL